MILFKAAMNDCDHDLGHECTTGLFPERVLQRRIELVVAAMNVSDHDLGYECTTGLFPERILQRRIEPVVTTKWKIPG